MNRKLRRMALAMGRKGVAKGEFQWWDYIAWLTEAHFDAPLSGAEREFSSQIVAWREAQDPVWYHGGQIGRALGDWLLPSAVTGADPRKLGDRIIARRDFVYITTDLSVARAYADEAQGVVYRVQPDGALQVDPTALRRRILNAAQERFTIRDHLHEFVEFTCPRAEVVEVLE